MLNQKLQQKLLQKLSPQQILLMKLLQVPTLALEQRIKQEIEENPALEEVADGLDDEYDQNDEMTYEGQDSDTLGEEHEEEGFEAEEPVFDQSEEFDIEDYMSDDDLDSYRYQINNTSADDEEKEIPFTATTTFHENLIQQLGLRITDPRKLQIANHIVGNLDDSGYLTRQLEAMVDELAFLQNIETNIKELEGVLSIIQELDPPGVGARTLRECLLIQLRRKPETESVRLAIYILERCFDEFSKKHYHKILKKAHTTESKLKDAIDEILKLNPKPGGSLAETSRENQYVVPDFFIYNNDGELELVLNSRNMPELRVNKEYTEMLETFSEARARKANQAQREAITFIKQKVDSARWFIDALRQRQNTLYIVMKAIMEHQREFFLTGDETRLKPMILKDIAEKVGLDISTVSRVANSKYVQTPYGTYLLKYFFSESLQNTEGEEVSTREVKKILEELIENEDKKNPLTDEELMDKLKEKGYIIARRTVAKYREQLGIPVARMRKEL